MKACGDIEIVLHAFLLPAPDGTDSIRSMYAVSHTCSQITGAV